MKPTGNKTAWSTFPLQSKPREKPQRKVDGFPIM